MDITKVIYTKKVKAPVLLAISVLLAGSFSGCASPPPPPPKIYDYSTRGDGDQILNRDVNGKSLSVVVRLYQLKDAQEFSKLTFDALASGRPESDFLGPALLAKTDAVIIPGGTYENSEKLLGDTKYVGIVAFFRQPDSFYWRQLADAETIRTQGLAFRVQDCYVMLLGDTQVPLPGQPASQRPDCGAGPTAVSPNPRTTFSGTGIVGEPPINNLIAPH